MHHASVSAVPSSPRVLWHPAGARLKRTPCFGSTAFRNWGGQLRYQHNSSRDHTNECHTIPAFTMPDQLVSHRVRKAISCSSSNGVTDGSDGSLTMADACNLDGWRGDVLRGGTVKFSDSSSVLMRKRAVMHWASGAPSRVLIVKKPGNPDASLKLKEIAAWLRARGIHVVVERPVAYAEFPNLDAYDAKIHPVDFCITLGGDGTVLHLASLFEHDDPLPPVISFAMGSLGFLTPFDVTEFAHYLDRVISANNPQSPLYVTLRTRRRCELKYGGERLAMHNVLNEVVVDRGACPGAVLLTLFTDGNFVTNIEADGLIISTPSGSTAYSMSAGGPMVTPSVPCSILTPIAPLSLSFRPLVIPESSDILIHLPEYARSNARISFDGKKALRMRKGSFLKVTPSLCPLPLINMSNLDTDWYEGITGKLKWNQTLREPPKLPSSARSTRSGDETDDDGRSFVSQSLQRESDEYNSQLERLSKM